MEFSYCKLTVGSPCYKFSVKFSIVSLLWGVPVIILLWSFPIVSLLWEVANKILLMEYSNCEFTVGSG